MKLLVSIHDVTPAWEAEVFELWSACRRRDVLPALLVVPNWHGAWPLDQHHTFVNWLRIRAMEGVEIFVHGERHDEIGLRRRWADEVRAWGRTAREAEFLTLDRAGARARIDRSVRLFRHLGIDPIGFVPPAWLAKPDCLRAVADVGLQFSEDMTTVHLMRTGRRVRAPVLRWSGRTAVRAWASVAAARLRWVHQRGEPVMRVAFHPLDVRCAVTARSIAVEFDRWLGERPAARYADLEEAPR